MEQLRDSRTGAHALAPAGKRGHWSAGAAILAGLLLAGAPAGRTARAADLPQPVPAGPAGTQWRFQATLYGWATGITGDVGVRHLPVQPVDVPFHEVLSNLDGAAMGAFYATNGTWMVLADLVLARLSHGMHTPVLGGSTLDLGLNQTIVTGAVGYVLPLARPDLDVAVTGGLRYMRLKADVSIDPIILPGSLGISQTEDWLDPTVGLFARWRLDPKWFVTGIVDIGGFGVGAQLSSSGYLGLGYQWTEGFSTGLGYRYLYEDYEAAATPTGMFRYRTTMHGPTLSLSWHF